MADVYRVIISPQASADLTAIHEFIARESPDAAARLVERILAALETLKTLPHRTVLERQKRTAKSPVRSLPIRPYVVFFRVVDAEAVVRVLTIRHGARRRPRRFD